MVTEPKFDILYRCKDGGGCRWGIMLFKLKALNTGCSGNDTYSEWVVVKKDPNIGYNVGDKIGWHNKYFYPLSIKWQVQELVSGK